ncbi:MAG: hypothetical protein DCC55_39320 [Chloroflexi bacterium]|nr:MAG: hypothetical protein DCC55_39320 [Chloroflexota bacterium]
MNEDTKAIIRSQYAAALQMLETAIIRCPESLWTDNTGKNRYWQVAYHTLFYVHLYLQPTEADFTPWAKGRAEYHFLGPTPWPPHTTPEVGEPYSQQEILEYLDLCRNEVEARVQELDLAAASGFDWLPFNKLELQFYNIRHLQHHVGELSGRLMTETGVEIDWVGMQARQT